eukprot:TRINITY_DN48456_c0_g1_i1.p1 TRINITY_DN48456_c0_g1~~TRINITY_DN48456_c0_g1_i1.p1  ORF type:complete len:1208 (+),score=281.31 TRINITY_DN48456_c0_g1_i1:59-3682(+)
MGDAKDAGEGPPTGSGLSAPREKDEEITRETFKQWTKDCGVKQIQKMYDEIAEAAVQNGRTLQQELKQQGYRDFNHFTKSCPRLSTFCWPIEFGEYGSGYVLYFQFLALLALILGLQFLIQIPAMVYYSSLSDLTDWRWHDWTMAYSTDISKKCECIGDEEGFAKTCFAWDLQSCPSEANCTFNKTKPGRWICQSWCYASEFCPTRRDGPLSNVHIRSSRRRGGGLVKAYSACEQDEDVLKLCDNDFRSRGDAYDHSDVDATISKDQFMSTFPYPGNCGPDECDNTLIPLLYIACLVLMCVLILLGYSFFMRTDRKVDGNNTSPSDFAVMVKGLPASARDEESIVKFFEQHAVKGKTDTEIVKVIIGWNIAEFKDNLKQIRKLSAELKDIPDETDPKAVELTAQIKAIRATMSKIGSADSELKSSGVVVVVFRYKSDMRACLEKWGTFWGMWFNCEAGPAGILKGPPLEKFPVGGRPIAKLSVLPAPEPGDINWAELAVPWKEKLQKIAKTNVIMFLILCVAFGITYGIRKAVEGMEGSPTSNMAYPGYTEPAAVADGGGNRGAMIALSLLVAVVNGILQAAAKYLGNMEYHDTLTDQEFSQSLKMSLAMVINTTGVLFFMYATPQEWYIAGGLADGIWVLLLVNTIVPPFLPYLDIPYYLVKGMTRRKLTDDLLVHWNKVLAAMGDPKQNKDPALKKEFASVQKQISAFKRAWSPSPLKTTKRYATSMKTFICCLLYQPVLPMLGLLGFLALFAQYWVDKWMMVNWNSRPPKPQNADMAHFFTIFVKCIAPIGLPLAVFVFITPSYGEKELVYSSFYTSLAIGCLFTFFCPLSLWVKCIFAVRGNTWVENQLLADYYHAQHSWSKDMKYHKDHPIYAVLPESKNPEFFKQGQAASTKAEEVGKFSCAAADKMADVAAASTGGAMVIKGGKVAGGDEDPDSAASAGAAGAIAPKGSTTSGTSSEPSVRIEVGPAVVPGTVPDDVASVGRDLDRVDGELSKEKGMNPKTILEAFLEIQPLYAKVADNDEVKGRLSSQFDTLKTRIGDKVAEAAKDEDDSDEAKKNAARLRALLDFARKFDSAQEALGNCSPGFRHSIARKGAEQDLVDAETELSKESGMNPMLILRNLRNLRLFWDDIGEGSNEEVAALHERLGGMCASMRGRITTSFEESEAKRPGLLKFAAMYDSAVNGLAGAGEANLKAELEAKG